MNHYFFVPVTHQTIKHDGVSLLDHLSMIDSELYQRSVCSFEERVSRDILHGFTEETRQKFAEKLLPTILIVVQGENGKFYELATREAIQMTTIDTFCEKEVLGVDVADYFYLNPDYVASALHFFDAYDEKKRKMNQKSEKGKLYAKNCIVFPRKTNK